MDSVGDGKVLHGRHIRHIWALSRRGVGRRWAWSVRVCTSEGYGGLTGGSAVTTVGWREERQPKI